MAAGVSVTKENGIARVVFDNPPINLFTIEEFLTTAQIVGDLSVDESVRVVILSSNNPDFFIAHFDVAAILTFPTDSPPATELNAYHVMCEQLRTMPKATIAVIEGRVGGGGSELALSCDMRFALRASKKRAGAVFNQPEVALGILPGGSGTQRLSRLVGRSRALEVILACDDVDAETAEQWGWVNRALPRKKLWKHVDDVAARIASYPAHAVAEAKAAVLLAEKGLEADLLAEGNAFNRTLGGPGTREAMEQFLAHGGQTRDGELRLGDLTRP